MPHKLFIPYSDRSLVSKVDSLLGRNGPDVDTLSEALLAFIEDKDQLQQWLRELLQDPQSVERITRLSYWHPNGFAKIVLHISNEDTSLLESPERFSIRLHVWPASSSDHRGDSNPHSHCWDFASTILLGEGMSTFEYYECRNCGAPYRQYVFGAVPDDKAALRTAGKEVWLSETPSLVVKPGQIYQCDTSVAHTVKPVGSGFTATIILRGPRKSASTAVYRRPGEQQEQPNLPMSELEVRKTIGEVIIGLIPQRTLV